MTSIDPCQRSKVYANDHKSRLDYCYFASKSKPVSGWVENVKSERSIPQEGIKAENAGSILGCRRVPKDVTGETHVIQLVKKPGYCIYLYRSQR